MRPIHVLGVVAAPVLFLLNLALAYRFATTPCEFPQRPLVTAFTVLSVGLMAVSGTLSFVTWRRTAGVDEERARFLVLVASMTTPLFIVVSLAMLFATWLVPPCV